MTWEAFWELIRLVGLPLALLIFALVSGALGMWVYGREFRAMTEDRNYWRETAERATGLAETTARTRPRRPRV